MIPRDNCPPFMVKSWQQAARAGGILWVSPGVNPSRCEKRSSDLYCFFFPPQHTASGFKIMDLK